MCVSASACVPQQSWKSEDNFRIRSVLTLWASGHTQVTRLVWQGPLSTKSSPKSLTFPLELLSPSGEIGLVAIYLYVREPKLPLSTGEPIDYSQNEDKYLWSPWSRVMMLWEIVFSPLEMTAMTTLNLLQYYKIIITQTTIWPSLHYICVLSLP